MEGEKPVRYGKRERATQQEMTEVKGRVGKRKTEGGKIG